MEKKEEFFESFKTAIISTIKSISNNEDIEVVFGNQNKKSDKKTINLPNLENNLGIDFIKIRAFADSEALKIRHSDGSILKSHEPKGNLSKKLYSISEKIRYEKLGSEEFKGVKSNINKYYQEKINNLDLKKDENKIVEAFENYLRVNILNLKNNKDIEKEFKPFKKSFDTKLKNKVKILSDSITNQLKFNSLISDLISQMNIDEDIENPKQNQEGKNEKNSENKAENNDKNSKEDKQENQEMSIETGAPDLDNQANESNTKDETIDIEDASMRPEIKRKNVNNFGDQKYKSYTDEFDETIKAEELESEDELNRLRQNLDQQLLQLKSFISKLANKLQRKLLAKQNRSWDFDLEEGTLDTSKLTRVIIDPFNSLSFKREKEVDFKDTLVTILIDNSGSMRGKPISVAAICADILSRTLEKCSVKVEILGFTTKHWKGGSCREKWINNNKPTCPGRLNDLRHIIYKSADTPWRQAKKNIGLMLKEGLLKENIDGEALKWAYQKMNGRKEERKILMVISDGAPVDDSTLSSNSSDFLENNLKNVVKWIEKNSKIELLAIGIGHDVTRYYSQAIKIADVQDLGDVMINQLTELFSEKKINKTIH
ncbi:cobalamin biosynthesis protein CobT [Pelagibacteraceae bacterium]|jgi:cobaltochelatase CobT|nr:cobalamin biosynthesis protein CobT [Pelagibacteraceae bacterium]|tara:strand:- start:8084 stop:9886 length:1803 start_codon:yes stop_codon:yes gene_type:complete